MNTTDPLKLPISQQLPSTEPYTEDAVATKVNAFLSSGAEIWFDSERYLDYDSLKEKLEWDPELNLTDKDILPILEKIDRKEVVSKIQEHAQLIFTSRAVAEPKLKLDMSYDPHTNDLILDYTLQYTTLPRSIFHRGWQQPSSYTAYFIVSRGSNFAVMH